MASHELKVGSRTEVGKAAAKRLRRAGLVPAVAYGQKAAPVKLAVDARQLSDLLRHHAARGLLTLKFEDGSAPDLPVIIKELQRHPVRHTVNAVDFLRVSLHEAVTAMVPITLVGEPIGVKQDGGILVQALHALEISALPQNLPEQIEVDVSALEFEGAPIHVGEITLPPGVTAITSTDESIAVVNAPRAEPAPTEEAEAEPGTEAAVATEEPGGEEP